ncbi:hypothetical protein [Actinocorallia sp. A-T 12471]|uniref:hypothetical protein n=1 Tax=Actinocorallia sp. A-T 12471 TaxID=3089813 RepID=UPI0029D3A85C|nr:hypothetical protein [Actinocorallia sp. A-T 12471]MDX6743626.1 hypothetical protein [Actinocorallia sp. A-T 12471]
MAEQGRDIDDTAQEIRFVTRGSMLAAYRMAAGLSQPEVAERFVEAAPGSVMDQPHLSRLEAFPGGGTRAPLATQIITLAGIYGTAPLRLLTAEALDALDPRERAVLLRCSAAFNGSSDVVERQEEATPFPSRFTATTGSPERQVEMAARKALRFAVMAEGANVGPETLEQLREEVSRLSFAYPQQALPTLFGDLVELQDVAFRILEHRQRPHDALDLYLLTGVICGMLAKASHDLGDPKSAMTQARTAYICADNAGHDGLRAWTRGLQSLISYWAGWPSEAVRYAKLGAEPAERTGGTASIWLTSQEARAWAILGHGDNAQAAIDRARDARENVRGDELDALGGIMSFTHPRQLYYVADTRIWLPGAERQAAEAAVEAISAYEAAPPDDRSFSDEAGARTDLALSRAASGDLDGALDALQPVFDLSHAQRIGGVISSMQRVHAALGAPNYRDVRTAKTARAEIEAFTQNSARTAFPR